MYYEEMVVIVLFVFNVLFFDFEGFILLLKVLVYCRYVGFCVGVVSDDGLLVSWRIIFEGGGIKL